MSKGVNPTEINIIKSQKVGMEQLLRAGDSENKAGTDAGETGYTIVTGKVDPSKGYLKETQETKMRTSCGLCGVGIATTLGLMTTTTGTAVFAWRASHRLNVTFPLIMKQATWFMIPVLSGAYTIHLFLAETMWSKRRNTFGNAWGKAVCLSAASWAVLIGSGTAFWRFGLKHTPLKRLYYQYPIPVERLETRMLEKPDCIFSGMCCTYWMVGLTISHLGFGTVAYSLIAANKAHYLMSPTGMYSYYCCPRWRREQIAKLANIDLPKSS